MADGYIRIDTKISNENFQKDLNLLKKSLTALTLSASAFGVKSVFVGKSFEKAMTQVGATMGLAVEDIRKGTNGFAELEEAARKAGSETEWSATEAAEALNYMALAGYDVEKSLKTLPSVLNLATAGGLNLAYASNLIVNSINALSLEVSNVSDFADVLVKTSQKASTDVDQLGQAILTVGGTARNLKGGVNELAASLGVLANNGIIATAGGTQLRNIILSLTSPITIASKELDRLGISAFDSLGNMRSLQDIFSDFNKVYSEFTQEEKTKSMSIIFNREDMKGVQALMKSTSGELTNLISVLEEARGTTAQTSQVMQDNLDGALKNLSSKFEELSNVIYKEMSPALRSSVDELAEFIENFAKEESVKEFANAIGEIANVLKDIAKTIIQSAVPVFKTFASALKFIADNINIIITAFASYKAGVIALSIANASAVGSMTAVWTTFNKFFKTTVVGSIITGVIYLASKLSEVKQLFDDLSDPDKKNENKLRALQSQYAILERSIQAYEQTKNAGIFTFNPVNASNIEESKKKLADLKKQIEELQNIINQDGKKDSKLEEQLSKLTEGMDSFGNATGKLNDKLEQTETFDSLNQKLEQTKKHLLDLKTEYSKGGLFNFELLTEDQKNKILEDEKIIEEIINRINSIQGEVVEKNKQVSDTIQSSWSEFTTAIGDSLENLITTIASGQNDLNSILSGLQSSMADIVSKMGDALITQGTALQISESMSPSAMIAYGLLMKSLAGIIKANLNNAGNFANGGIVGGNSYSGDRLTANVNSGELILNMAQQDAIANRLLATSQSSPMVNITVINNSDSQVEVSQDNLGNIKLLIDSEINNYMTGPSGQKMLKSNYGISKIGVK